MHLIQLEFTWIHILPKNFHLNYHSPDFFSTCFSPKWPFTQIFFTWFFFHLNFFHLIFFHFEVIFKANPTVRLLNTSVDIKIDFTVSFEPVDGFWQFKTHFVVVFQGQSNGEVTVYISWHGKSYLQFLIQ